nr:aminopeptidase M1-like [Tanacetum cinerariifolium]
MDCTHLLGVWIPLQLASGVFGYCYAAGVFGYCCNLQHGVFGHCPFSSYEKVKEVEEFFASCAKPSIARTLKQSIERVQINAKWVETC